MKHLQRTIVPLLLALLLFCFSGCLDPGMLGSPEQTTQAGTSAAPADKQEPVSLSDIPAFNGKAYVSVNGGVPFFEASDYTTTPFETYAPLDALGRCGVAYANICRALMPTEEREPIGQVKPSGWQTAKYDFIDGKYLFNRCHLIGFQLAGENANERNLITGTRYLNIQGMLPFENMVADYVKETNHHVLFRVTPVYNGNNLVASGVLMEAYSVEDAGDGISFCVYAYNVQPGVYINYANGDNRLATEEEVTSAPETEAGSQVPARYIINTSSKVFHTVNCASAVGMSEANKEYTTRTAEELLADAYTPCGRCRPTGN